MSNELTRYAAELQGAVDKLKSALAEFDTIASQATDTLTKDALSRGRGHLLGQIETHRSEWVRYATHPDMTESEYAQRVGMLKL